MGKYHPILVFLLLLPACASTDEQPQPLTAEEREAKVDALLEPAAVRLKTTIGDRRAGVTRFVKEGADFEPRVSQYIVPRLTDRLVEAGAAMVERRELDKETGKILMTEDVDIPRSLLPVKYGGL
jgi:hypothetical protein